MLADATYGVDISGLCITCHHAYCEGLCAGLAENLTNRNNALEDAFKHRLEALEAEYAHKIAAVEAAKTEWEMARLKTAETQTAWELALAKFNQGGRR